jgi:Zn-dependent M28 family amino/carboxypeptidase
MFHAYGAEEEGLVGSNHFCSHPLVPMDSVVAMLNFDMVGRLRGRGAVEMRGVSTSNDWDSRLSAANAGALSLEYVDGALDRSDQYCFYQAEKPVLMFHTGTHGDYHTPTDDVWLIDTAGMVEIGDLGAAVLDNLVADPEPPLFPPFVSVDR